MDAKSLVEALDSDLNDNWINDIIENMVETNEEVNDNVIENVVWLPDRDRLKKILLGRKRKMCYRWYWLLYHQLRRNDYKREIFELIARAVLNETDGKKLLTQFRKIKQRLDLSWKNFN